MKNEKIPKHLVIGRIDFILPDNPDDLETDNDGQLIIYTSIYRWGDGSYHSSAEFDCKNR